VGAYINARLNTVEIFCNSCNIQNVATLMICFDSARSLVPVFRVLWYFLLVAYRFHKYGYGQIRIIRIIKFCIINWRSRNQEEWGGFSSNSFQIRSSRDPTNRESSRAERKQDLRLGSRPRSSQRKLWYSRHRLSHKITINLRDVIAPSQIYIFPPYIFSLTGEMGVEVGVRRRSSYSKGSHLSSSIIITRSISSHHW